MIPVEAGHPHVNLNEGLVASLYQKQGTAGWQLSGYAQEALER
jgi:hypothetical protein